MKMKIYRVKNFPTPGYSKHYLYLDHLLDALRDKGVTDYEVIEEIVPKINSQWVSVPTPPHLKGEPGPGYYDFTATVTEPEFSQVYFWAEDLTPVVRGKVISKKKIFFVYFDRNRRRWYPHSHTFQGILKDSGVE